MRPILLVLALVPCVAHAERRVPFWPDEVPAAIAARVDGVAVLAAATAIAGHHRVQGSPGYRAAADWVVGELTAAGLAGAAVESLPADGKTRYAHFRSYPGWTASEGRLDMVEPEKQTLADYAASKVALADYSQDADVTAELVDAGAGVASGDYQGKDVRGKLVLADGDPFEVHALAVEERGAAGFVSDYPNVYYYNYLHEVLGDYPRAALGKRGGLHSYEALNLVDGKRSVSEIRDILAGRVGAAPVEEVAAYFELLARAGVIRWR